jgi:hypothetical protein
LDSTAACAAPCGLDDLPTIIRARGERTIRSFIEFFTATIRNRNTRMVYARAVKQFFDSSNQFESNTCASSEC